MTTKEYNKAYYEANKEKWKEYNYPEKHNKLAREYYHRNKEVLSQKKREWDENHYEWNLWAQTKRRAKREGIYWDLKQEDIVIPLICPFLKCPLTRTQGKGLVWSNASVDRIDNSKGYTKDNIMIISRMANSMKQHATQEQLLQFAFSIIEMHRQNQIQDDDHD